MHNLKVPERKRTQEAIENLFYQYAAILEEEGFTDHKEVFIDGTKLESRANRHAFVWKKTVDKQLAKIKERVKTEMGIRKGYVTRNGLRKEFRHLNGEIEAEEIEVKRARGHHKPEIVRRRDTLNVLLER